MARDAVIVSTARTPHRQGLSSGAFNATPAPTLAAHLAQARRSSAPESTRARSTTSSWGAALTAGHAVRQHRPHRSRFAPAARSPSSGMTIDRQCASGLMAIATAAKQIIVDRMDVVAAGGVRIASAWCRRREMRIAPDPSLIAMHKRRLHADDRDRRDRRPALRHQPRAAGRICAAIAAAHRRGAGRRPVRRRDRPRHHDDGGQGQGDRRGLACRRSRSPRTRATAPTRRSRALRSLEPVLGPDTSITAGNASQLSDGARPRVLMEASDRRAARARSRSAATSAWRSPAPSPTRWASARSFAVPKLLKRFGLKVDDIGLWELNEAFAVQVLYCAGQARHPRGPAQRRRRRDLDRPPLRHERARG